MRPRHCLSLAIALLLCAAGGTSVASAAPAAASARLCAIVTRAHSTVFDTTQSGARCTIGARVVASARVTRTVGRGSGVRSAQLTVLGAPVQAAVSSHTRVVCAVLRHGRVTAYAPCTRASIRPGTAVLDVGFLVTRGRSATIADIVLGRGAAVLSSGQRFVSGTVTSLVSRTGEATLLVTSTGPAAKALLGHTVTVRLSASGQFVALARGQRFMGLGDRISAVLGTGPLGAAILPVSTLYDLGHLPMAEIAPAHTGSTAGTTDTDLTGTSPTQPGGNAPGNTSPGGTPPAASVLSVSGNELKNASGNVIQLHGLDKSGTEYMCTEGYGIFDGPTGDSEYDTIQTWDVNSVLLGLNEDCWLGINGTGINNWAADSGTSYISAIKAEVSAAESHGLYPVIAFFWGDPGTDVSAGNDPNGGGQPALPDDDHAPLFWEEVADTFKNDPNVIFRLQEEPHPSGITLPYWQCWSQGDVQYGTDPDNAYGTPPTPSGSVSHCSENDTKGSGHSYSTVGMQSLINIIRGTGAANVIQVPGLGYANLMACSATGSPTSCGFLDSTDGVRVSDPLSTTDPQLMADVDVYPDQGQVCDSVTCYNDTFAPVAAVMPFDAGETGPSGSTDTKANQFLDWLDGEHQSYYAWAWDTWANLISNYDGTRDAPWGTDYYDRLTGTVPPAPAQPTDGITMRQAVSQSCADAPSATITLPQAVTAGDDLFVVVGSNGYTADASTVTGVSDNKNGTWTEVDNPGSQLGGSMEYAASSVYELQGSAAAAGALTITIAGHAGQSGASAVALDVGGVASISGSAFDTTVQGQTSVFTSPPIASVPSGDVVLGLYGSYSQSSQVYSAPTGWNTSNSYWTVSQTCGGAAIDWTQTTAAGSATATINGDDEYHYSTAIDLHP